MNKIIAAILVVLAWGGSAWGTTYYIQNNSGTIEYNTTSCTYTGEWTDGTDLETIMTAGSAGDTFDGCDDTYTGTEIDGDSGLLVDSNNMTFQNMTLDVNGAAVHGISFYARSGGYLKNSVITGADQAEKGGVSLNIASNITIDGCTIYGNTRGIAFVGANDNDAHDISITNNSIHTNSEHGIWWNTGDVTEGETGKAYNIVITGNDIYDNGIGIKANSVDRANGANEYSSAIIIRDNNIYSNETYGCSLSDADKGEGIIYIERNNIYNNGDTPAGGNANGLWLGNVAYAVVKENIVYNNQTGNVDGVGIFLDYGADGYPSSYCIIDRNTVYGHDSCKDQVPWHAEDSYFNSSGIGLCCGVNNNTVTNNILYGNAVGISLGGAAGKTTASNLLYNNTMYNNRIGVQIDLGDAGATGNILKNNIISGNTYGDLDNYGIYFDATNAIGAGDITLDYNCHYDNDTELSDPGVVGFAWGANTSTTDPSLDSNYGATVKLAGTWIATVPYDYNGHARWRYDTATAGWFTQMGALNMPKSEVFDCLGIIAIDSDHPQAGPFSGRWIEWYRNTFRRVR